MKYLMHIGYHKTGSTLFQKKFFNGSIEGLNPIIPKHFKDPNNGKFSKLFGKEIIKETVSNAKPNVKNLKKLLEQEYTLIDNGYNVISNEALSGIGKLSFSGGKEFCDTIVELFPESKILIGIREQRSWMVSLYYQYLRMGGTLSAKKYFKLSETNYFSNSIVYSHLCYDRLIDYYYNSFGENNVYVYTHEDLLKAPQRIIDEISNFLSLKINIDNSIFKEKVNKKYSLTCLELSRRLSPILYSVQANGYSSLGLIKSERIRERFLSFLNKVIPDVFSSRLKNNLLKRLPVYIYDDFKDSNRRLSELINKDLSSQGYMK